MSKTRVRSIRASEGFWRDCKKCAKSKKTDVNKLIVGVVEKYLKEQNKSNEKGEGV